MTYLFVILLAADPGAGGHTGLFARNVYEYRTVAACEVERARLVKQYQQPNAAQALISDCAGAQDRLVYHSYSPAKGEPS
jgi:hypothetical protein